MFKPSFVFSIIFVISIFLFFSCKSQYFSSQKENVSCQRIVSTSPSITETLFEMGLGDKVVAVSNDCSFIDETKGLDKIGRVLDLSYESILIQKPDTVIFTSYHSSRAEKLSRSGINTIVVDHSTLSGFMASMSAISELCGNTDRASNLVEKYNNILKNRQKTDNGKKNKKVMIVVGREYLDTNIKDVYIAGNDGFYNDLLKLFDVDNAYEGNIAYPKIQMEGIISMNPDIIIDVATYPEITDEELEKTQNDWKIFEDVNAASSNRIFVVNRTYWSVPGPRFVNIIEDMNTIFKSERGTIIK